MTDVTKDEFYQIQNQKFYFYHPHNYDRIKRK